jgi:hypothetical protein
MNNGIYGGILISLQGYSLKHKPRFFGGVILSDRFSSPEWTSQEWQQAWSIGVGQLFECKECGNKVMVVRGGTGTLEPRCHNKPMVSIEAKK